MFKVEITGDLEVFSRREVARFERTTTLALEAAGSGAQLEMRYQTTREFKSRRLGGSWRLKMYKNANGSAAAFVYSKAGAIAHGFATGATIRPLRGKYLTLPTNFNRPFGRRGGEPIITPEEMAKMPPGSTFVQRSKGGRILWFLRIQRAGRLNTTGGAIKRSGITDAYIPGKRGQVRGDRRISNRRSREQALKYGAVPMFELRSVLKLSRKYDMKRARDIGLKKFNDQMAASSQAGAQ